MNKFLSASFILMLLITLLAVYLNSVNSNKLLKTVNEHNSILLKQNKIIENFYSSLKINGNSIRNLIVSNDTINYEKLDQLKDKPFHTKLIICSTPSDCSVCLKKLAHLLGDHYFQDKIVFLTTNKNFKMAKLYQINSTVNATIYETSVSEINKLIQGSNVGPFLFIIDNNYNIKKFINIHNLQNSMLDSYLKHVSSTLLSNAL